MKPKLLFVLHSLTIGGAESLVLQMAEALEAKYQIGILCLDGKGALWDRGKEAGFWLSSLNRKPGLKWANFKKAASSIEDFSPDLIHAHQYTPFLYSAVSRMLGKTEAKIIFTEHGRHFPDIVSTKRKLANKFLSKHAEVITGVSDFSAAGLKNNEGFSSHEIRVIYNGLKFQELNSIEAVSIREELGVSAEKKIIGYVGSLREVKNPLSLLRAFSQVAKQIENVDLVYIGDGPLRAELEAGIKTYGLEQRVHLAGVRLPASPYFKSLDLFVQPSLSEACSLALLEAMYREVPVVISNGGGGPEIVEHEKSGLVVEVNDDKALTDAILASLDITDLNIAGLDINGLDIAGLDITEELSKRITSARHRVETEFHFASMLKAYEGVYESCL